MFKGLNRNSTVFEGVFAPDPIPLEKRLARATGSRQRVFLIGSQPRAVQSGATEGRKTGAVDRFDGAPVNYRCKRSSRVSATGFANRGSCGDGR